MNKTKIMNFTVTVLGSGTCVPSPNRYPSSYFVKTPVAPGGWIVDLGSGALQRLAQTGKSYKNIHSVFISHTHEDHFSSFLPLLQALNFTPGYKRTEPLYVYGPSEIEIIIRNYFTSVSLHNLNFPVHFIDLSMEKEINYNGWSLVSKKMKHSADTIGFRFNIGGNILVYGSDTEPCDEIIKLAEGANLLLLECSFTRNNPSPGHLTTFQAGEIAKLAKVKKLLLSHFYPEVSEMLSVEREKEVRDSGYLGEVIFADDLLEITI